MFHNLIIDIDASDTDIKWHDTKVFPMQPGEMMDWPIPGDPENNHRPYSKHETNYTFLGWTKNNEKIPQDAPEKIVMGDEDIHYYSHWARLPYLQFNPNINIDDQPVHQYHITTDSQGHEVPYLLPSTCPFEVPEGAEFAGWSKARGDDTQRVLFVNPEDVRDHPIDGIEIFALWRTKIKAHTNLIADPDWDRVVILDGLTPEFDPSPSTTAETFKGWFLDEEFTIPYEVGVVIEKPFDIYQKVEFPVNFISNIPEYGNISVMYNSTTPLQLLDLKYSPYNLIGWFIDPACTEPADSLEGTILYQTTTFYGKWENLDKGYGYYCYTNKTDGVSRILHLSQRAHDYPSYNWLAIYPKQPSETIGVDPVWNFRDNLQTTTEVQIHMPNNTYFEINNPKYFFYGLSKAFEPNKAEKWFCAGNFEKMRINGDCTSMFAKSLFRSPTDNYSEHLKNGNQYLYGIGKMKVKDKTSMIYNAMFEEIKIYPWGSQYEDREWYDYRPFLTSVFDISELLIPRFTPSSFVKHGSWRGVTDVESYIPQMKHMFRGATIYDVIWPKDFCPFITKHEYECLKRIATGSPEDYDFADEHELVPFFERNEAIFPNKLFSDLKIRHLKGAHNIDQTPPYQGTYIDNWQPTEGKAIYEDYETKIETITDVFSSYGTLPIAWYVHNDWTTLNAEDFYSDHFIYERYYKNNRPPGRSPYHLSMIPAYGFDCELYTGYNWDSTTYKNKTGVVYETWPKVNGRTGYYDSTDVFSGKNIDDYTYIQNNAMERPWFLSEDRYFSFVTLLNQYPTWQALRAIYMMWMGGTPVKLSHQEVVFDYAINPFPQIFSANDEYFSDSDAINSVGFYTVIENTIYEDWR